MKIGSWARLLLAAAPMLAGCGNFWQAPGGSTSFTLTNSGNISVAQSSTGTSTITVTPANSFTGTVALTCAVTSSLSSPTSPTCSLSSTSVSITGTTALTSTLTVTTASGTTLGAYTIKVTGTSGSLAGSTSLCAEVSNSSGTCTSASTSGNFYILNADSIKGYSIQSGVLTAITGSSETVTGASAVAMGPSGNFLYVASTSSGIILYTISSTGALTAGSQVYGDTQSQSIQVDPSGKWLIDVSSGGTINAIPITSTGAADSSRSIYAPALSGIPIQVAISPNSALIAVAMGSTGTEVIAFNANATNGSPFGANPILYAPETVSTGSAASVAMDPQSRLLYVGEVNALPNNGNNNTGGLRVFSISGSTTTEFTYSAPYASGGLAPHFILPIASGNYVYVANGKGNGVAGNVTGFAVTATALTTGSTVAAGAQPAGMAEDSTGSFVFEVGSSGSPYFDAYTFDSNVAGQLNSQVTSTSAASSKAIVAAP